ncbi:phage/plasmid primase, P4 family, C-terminal domain-containing protein [Bauldia litoralis]|uniref:Phage/plasmid primase, P4 family, C-terminal domain-containing protein n=2 Tax=Bauldia litoralis TaxID=665467 RepID=A0A1G6DTR4_9HYPH|nr:phage/plasmid primase, P4 family, C-terminal domain-containing protein [Bauldia litoralis]
MLYGKPKASVNQATGDEMRDMVLNRQAPLTNAREFLLRERLPPIKFWRGAFYIWVGSHYRQLEDQAVDNGIWMFLDKMKVLNDKGAVVEFNPQPQDVRKTFEALKPITMVSTLVEAPSWLANGIDKKPADCIAFTNGIYHWPSKTLLKQDPDFFNTAAIGVAYDNALPPPTEWLGFLNTLWPDDPDSIRCLRQIIGYLMTYDTSFQKIFAFIGVKRGGKGTILRVIQEIMGRENYSSSTASDFGSDFGLQSAIDKLAVFFPDMIMKGLRGDAQAKLAGNFKAISGEDSVNAKRKYLSDYVGKLSARIVLAANEAISVSDASGALSSRLILLKFTHSFYGNEDRTLFSQKLRPELASIAMWALAGLDDLNEQHHFTQSQSGTDEINDIERLGSPVAAFVADRCTVATGAWCLKDQLYVEWGVWCSRNNAKTITLDQFARDLFSNLGAKVSKGRPTIEGKRVHTFTGIAINPE